MRYGLLALSAMMLAGGGVAAQSALAIADTQLPTVAMADTDYQPAAPRANS